MWETGVRHFFQFTYHNVLVTGHSSADPLFCLSACPTLKTKQLRCWSHASVRLLSHSVSSSLLRPRLLSMATEPRGHSWGLVSVDWATAVTSSVSCGAIGLTDVNSVESTERWLECGVNFPLCLFVSPLLSSPLLLLSFLRWGSTSQTCMKTCEMDTT